VRWPDSPNNLENLNMEGKKLLKFVLNKVGRCGMHSSADLPKIGTSAGLLWRQQATFEFHKGWRISYLTERALERPAYKPLPSPWGFCSKGVLLTADYLSVYSVGCLAIWLVSRLLQSWLQNKPYTNTTIDRAEWLSSGTFAF
jgi:hypothetical protein